MGFLNDSTQEGILRPGIENSIYTLFYKFVESVNDKERQLLGIDTILDDGNHDFKVQMNKYICNIRRTFALEIDGRKYDPIHDKYLDEIVLGWLLRQMATDWYDFMWILHTLYILKHPDGKNPEDSRFILNAGDLRTFEFMTLNVRELKKRIFEMYPAEKLREWAIQLRNQHLNDKSGTYVMKLDDKNNFRLVLSKDKPEQPINLVVPQKWLAEFAARYFKYDNGTITDFLTGAKYSCPKITAPASTEEIVIPCPRCGKSLKRRINRYGREFLGCSAYFTDKCTYTRDIRVG